MPVKFLFALLIFAVCAAQPTFAQTETLTNSDVIEMTQAGIGNNIIVQKIGTTGSDFDVSAKALIELKKAQVADDVIASILQKAKVQPEKAVAGTIATNSVIRKSLAPSDILRSARTITIHKTSLNPSPQALEKELIKRPDWQKFNLSLTEDKENADLAIEIGFVPLSIVTHRYAFRVYDRRSGLVLAAGETTSWGSLSKHLAREICEKLNSVNSH